jgi:hypothetical protein
MTKPQLRLLVLVAALLIGPSSFLTADSSHAQAAANPEHDLWGSNIGDSILLKWLGEPGATQYIVYRGISITGPWTDLFRDSDIDRVE